MRSVFSLSRPWYGVLSLVLSMAVSAAYGAEFGGQGLQIPQSSDPGSSSSFGTAPSSTPSPTPSSTPSSTPPSSKGPAAPKAKSSSPKAKHAAPAAAPAAAAPAAATAAPAAAPAPDQVVDGIAAVVNKDVITLRELNEAVKGAVGELTRQGIQLPDSAILQRQVLQRLIMQRLQRQEADRLGIKVESAAIDQAIAGIAARNKISVDQMHKEVEKSGITWDQYRRNLADEVRADRLRQRTVDANIIITDAEVDAFLKEQQRHQGDGGFAQGPGPTGAPAAGPAPVAQAAPAQASASAGPVRMALAQILVRVPEGSSPEQVSVLRKKAQDILARLKKGEDFASLAAAASDGPEALQGGMMGARALDDWPDLFVKAVANLQRGEVSDLIQSGNGFHILKVVDRAGGGAAPGPATDQQQGPGPAPAPNGPQDGSAMTLPQGPMQVTQTHARHILIKTSAVMSDDQAQQRLTLLRQRIVSGGEDFAALAHQNSQDATAPQGGDLGWLSPGETVPPFEAAMNALKPGEISQPIQSPFGWHLIQVLERRQKDVADEVQRMQARRVLFERRAEPAFEDWLDQLRDQAYIDNRLEKKSQQDRNDR